MQLKHTTPCAECPWRRDALVGYLGGNDVQTYTDHCAEGMPTPCHMDEEAACAGCLGTMRNSAKLPSHPEWMVWLNEVDLAGSTALCHANFYAFWEYHGGEGQYQTPLMRKLMGTG